MKFLQLGAKSFPAFRNVAKAPEKDKGKQSLAFLQTITDCSACFSIKVFELHSTQIQ
jgi:hypothetical protein